MISAGFLCSDGIKPRGVIDTLELPTATILLEFSCFSYGIVSTVTKNLNKNNNFIVFIKLSPVNCMFFFLQTSTTWNKELNEFFASTERKSTLFTSIESLISFFYASGQ